MARPWTIAGAVVLVGMLLASGVPSVLDSGRLAPRSSMEAPAPHTSNSTSTGGHASLGRELTAARTHQSLAQHQIPKRDAYLPAYRAGGVVVNGTVRPLYTSAPAPIGVGDFGISRLPNGTMSGSRLETSSIRGTLTVSSVSAFYLDDDAPDSWGAQLNTVVANVTILGNSSFSFWTQNVLFYTGGTHQLQFLDNVWNFSSAATLLPANSIRSGNGTTVAPTYYYALGPTFTVRTPFTVNLYTNTTVLANRSTVFFNYTITNGSHTTAGSYDKVVFNSTGPGIRGAPTPMPAYRIDGRNLTPTGYLLYDAELVLGGPGGGSTTNFASIVATMQLATWNATSHAFDPVPAAFDYGTDTGETASGVNVWFSTAPSIVAHLATGPSFLGPLWGTGGVAGHLTIQAVIFPSNAFLLFYPGPLSAFNESGAQFTPHLTNPSPSTFSLPYGTYSYRAELSDYVPIAGTIANLSQLLTLVLTYNQSYGIYTPLFASNNGQLPALATAGNGSLTAPYVLQNVEATSLGLAYAQLNDFLFPVYPGVLLANTNASVLLLNPPPFEIYYPSWAQPGLKNMGLPTSNDLQIELYNASHVTIANATGISGWFFGPYLQGFPAANLLLWNTTSVLVAGCTFLSDGSSMLAYGGTNDTVWGNRFVPLTNLPFTYLNPAFDAADPLGSGITIEANGDLVYNNYFAGQLSVPAASPPVDIYTGLARSFSDHWNVSSAPANTTRVVNGVPLSGNILGGPTEGGNFWWNYGSPADPYGTLPYTDLGAIAVGGDYLPLTAPLFPVNFDISGLSASDHWSVLVNGTQRLGSGNGSAAFLETSGGYSYTVTGPAGYLPGPVSGRIVVLAPVTVSILYKPVPILKFAVEFIAEGLPAGATWSLQVAGNAYRSSAPVITLLLPNGSYPYAASAADFVTPASGSVNVNGGATSVTLLLVPLDGTLVVQVSPTNASVRLNGSAISIASNGSGHALAPPGEYPLAVSAVGFSQNLTVQEIRANRTTTVTVTLQRLPGTNRTGGGSTGIAPAIAYALGAVFAILAVALAASLLRRRSAVASSPAVPWKETEGSAKPTSPEPSTTDSGEPPRPP